MARTALFPVIAMGAALATVALAQSSNLTSSDRQRLIDAKTQSAAAAARSERLELDAAGEKDAATRARAEEAAVAAKVDQAAADIAAGQARLAIVQRLLDDQRARLAARQGPIVRLIAALQSLARRPAVFSVVQPGSIDDLVHVRAVLATELPVVRARTAGLRAGLAQARALAANATLATRALADSRTTLETQRLALARLEARHRDRAQALGHAALFESDRAIALGEQARDLVDLMNQQGDAAATRVALAALPGPEPRPPRPGEAAAFDAIVWPHDRPPYRLPVAGQVVTGLGEVSEAGVRARGLTLRTAPSAAVIVPADGRVAYAGVFRDYGTIVIIDHGRGWTTLVTGLTVSPLRVGERVAQGDPLGTAPVGDDPRITIELRRGDRPIDMTPLIG